MAKTRKGGKKRRKRAGTARSSEKRPHGSFILLNNAEKKAVLQDLEAIEGMARGSEIELKIRSVRETLHNSTFSGASHFIK
jgi:hypothetical protein